MPQIDYLGFRLTAVSLLPISNKTIVYGSSDGGVYALTSPRSVFLTAFIRTVHADDEKANALMEEVTNFTPSESAQLLTTVQIVGAQTEPCQAHGRCCRTYR